MRPLTIVALSVALALPGTLVQAQGDIAKGNAAKSAGAKQNGVRNGSAVKNSLPETAMDKLAAEQEKKTIFEDPLQGVIVNRTVTVLGNDFYQYFSTYWNELNENNRYSIAIYERPTARWGSEIWIQFRQDRVFHTFLSPARQAAKGVAETAAAIVEQNITRTEIHRMTFQDHDLAPEEL